MEMGSTRITLAILGAAGAVDAVLAGLRIIGRRQDALNQPMDDCCEKIVTRRRIRLIACFAARLMCGLRYELFGSINLAIKSSMY